MPGNHLGRSLTLTSWGESHGPAIGGVIDGLPPGIPLDMSLIQQQLDRRRPGQSSFVTPRNELDHIQVLSGFFGGKTLGTPLAFIIHNQNQKSSDYTVLKDVFRPGHADYTYQQKYGHVDHRGGGRASARETAIRVVAGAVATQLLNHMIGPTVKILAALVQLGHKKTSGRWVEESISTNPFFCPDPSVVGEWGNYLTEVREAGKSVGALIEIQASGIPAGLGEPVYDKLDADLAKALMSINAVKAVEIGDGFGSATAETGFDEMGLSPDSKVTFTSNKAGGILGGISTGQPIVCRIALKPTSSTKQVRTTLTKELIPTTLGIHGRHDPCVGIRAVPIAQSMVAFTLADHLLRWRGQCGPIGSFDRDQTI
ncbi:chorismate synthase [Candidatus Paracaedibacter symbiosus]|uniref:chorismate synthase n=1 Tax=Candidatus Paracaedibacter symbiosus TaxID=244582 RepID=UPI000509F716|nr:chorismate synthase [Candidatus Paracaedibacter symbiosus]